MKWHYFLMGLGVCLKINSDSMLMGYENYQGSFFVLGKMNSHSVIVQSNLIFSFQQNTFLRFLEASQA